MLLYTPSKHPLTTHTHTLVYTHITDVTGTDGADVSQDETRQSSGLSRSGSSGGMSGKINRVSAGELNRPSLLLYTPYSHEEGRVDELRGGSIERHLTLNSTSYAHIHMCRHTRV